VNVIHSEVSHYRFLVILHTQVDDGFDAVGFQIFETDTFRLGPPVKAIRDLLEARDLVFRRTRYDDLQEKEDAKYVHMSARIRYSAGLQIQKGESI
jgi:hypothetical protein